MTHRALAILCSALLGILPMACLLSFWAGRRSVLRGLLRRDR